MNVRAIRTPEDHAWALAQIESLWDKAEPGTSEGDRFEVLSTLIDAYEREHFPIPAPDPVEAIRFRMEQQGLSPRDLLPCFKTTARVSEVLNRRRRLNLSMIRFLSMSLQIPVEALIVDYPLARTKQTKHTRIPRKTPSHS